MSVVAFVGLGSMGSRMAHRMLEAGHVVVVWNRTTARALALVDAGARLASTPAEAADGADVVITMVRDPAALRAVTEGPDGVAAGVGAATVIEMSTVGPGGVAWLAAALPAKVEVLDAPVLGSIAEAEAGTLQIFVGGPRDLVERHSGLLGVLGTPVHVGPLGSGAAAKLVANATLFGVLGVLGESLALARGLGLTDDDAFAVLAITPLAAQAERRRAVIEAGEYPARFPLSLARKDAALVTEAAAEAGIDLRLARAAQSWLVDAEQAGLGGKDYTGVLSEILRTTDTVPEATSITSDLAPPHVTSVTTAGHYRWGDGCEGWRLTDRSGLSVIEEQVPPGRAEEWHVHDQARQFFYVLTGEAIMRTPQADLTLQAGGGVEISPGTPHQLANISPHEVRFLVISSPTTIGDRRPFHR